MSIKERTNPYSLHKGTTNRPIFDSKQPAQQEPLFKPLIALHPGLAKELKEMDAPAQRTWVGLTDEEIDAEATQHEQAHGFIQGVQWATAKLKEKNT